MKIIECPNFYHERHDEDFSIFLAGATRNCPDWPITLAQLLVNTNYVIFTPSQDPTLNIERQIEWEFQHIRQADMLVFWLCKNTVQPITMFELGAWAMTNKPMVVGIEPGYALELDVIARLKLVRPDVVVFDDLNELANGLIEFDNHLKANNV